VRRHEHGRAASLGCLDQAHELLLQERVEAGGRLVEDQQLGLVHEGLDDADLLPVAPGQTLDLPIKIEAEPVGQLVDPRGRDPAAQIPQVREQLASRLPAVHDEVAGQVPDLPAHLDAVGARVEAQHPDASGGRPDQVQQDPDGGGLAGAVGAQIPVHLTGLDLEIQAREAAVAPAVRLDQAIGLDGRVSHRSVPSLPRSAPLP
jgi:hypothetical protein